MSKSDVLIEWKSGDSKNDRHMGRYLRCFYELIKELSSVPEAKTVLDKYYVECSDDYRVNLDFPEDFDQSVLPGDLR